MLAIMSDLLVRLALHRLTESPVHICRARADQCVLYGRVRCFLVRLGLDVRVVCLAAAFGNGVGGVGVAGRRGACGEGLRVVFWALVAL
jgi:hypothetical protein